MNNILITSAGRRVSLTNFFKNELKKIDSSAKVFALDAELQLSAAAQIADCAFHISKVSGENYIPDLLRICLDNHIKLIIPTIDTELEILSINKDLFQERGINIVVSDREFIEVCNNKKMSHTFFEQNGISVPNLYSKTAYKLPLFIKPVNGSSSKNNYLIWQEGDFLKTHFENDDLLFFEYIDHTSFDEFTCDAYYDQNSILKCVIPRKRIEIRGGEVSKGLTKNNVLVDIIKNKLNPLRGARGCITMQFFVHKENKDIIAIEINGRFGGGFPLSYLAGGNYPKWILEEYLLGKEIENFDNWEEDLLMLRYDSEILVHGYKG
ncbi:MAG: ATP-grasp domain-containing protein [Bacteroidota bacterium]